MDKEKYSVKCVEIEGGYKIEIKGPDLKGIAGGCCVPLIVKCGDSKSGCCPPEEKKDNP